MKMDSVSIEKLVEDFLESTFRTDDYSTNKEVQKKRFFLLSKLVADLFNCKNSSICFHNISNLIILLLNIYNEKFPVDLYSNDKRNIIKKPNSKIKHVMKNEFHIE